jgi:FkbM family methyltransferase
MIDDIDSSYAGIPAPCGIYLPPSHDGAAAVGSHARVTGATATSESLREQLEGLLEHSAKAVIRRERTAFDEAASPNGRRIVIYGAGGLGRRILAGLRANGVEPLAFADQNPAASSGAVSGVPIYSPTEAVRLFGFDSVFVVAVWNPVASGGIAEISAMLAERGCRRIVPFVWLFWKYPETFLPYYLWDLPSRALAQAEHVRSAFDLFEGVRSQMEFIRQLGLRLTGDVKCLGGVTDGVQYFPERLFRPRSDEYFVDCGAYDGDTLISFAKWTGGRFQGAMALEPDPANFAALKRCVAEKPELHGRVQSVHAAVGASRSKVQFAASGLASAAISADGAIAVDCLPLDEVLEGEAPTYIKMDIEGAEMDALNGSASILDSHQPLLAICAYHTQDHLWRIPLRIRELTSGARLLLRPHRMDGFDLVCYAVPSGRALDASLEGSPA